jgi:hypothetical protein
MLAAMDRQSRPPDISLLGIFLSLLFFIGGLSLVYFPKASYSVLGSKRTGYYVDQVSEDRCRFYGAFLCVFGMALATFSLHRPGPPGG